MLNKLHISNKCEMAQKVELRFERCPVLFGQMKDFLKDLTDPTPEKRLATDHQQRKKEGRRTNERFIYILLRNLFIFPFTIWFIIRSGK
jgi:hypothetical protein